VSAELIRPFPKDRQRKTGGRMHGNSRIQTDTPENIGIEKQRAQMGDGKYSGKTLENKIV